MNKRILQIAVPAIISNMTVPLLGLVDTAIAGHLERAIYIEALALGALFFSIVYWLFGFLRMGTSGFTAQAFGKGDKSLQLKILIQGGCTAILLGLLIIALQQPLLTITIHLLQPTEELASLMQQYIKILIWGAPATLTLYLFYGWFVGMQNTTYQMYLAIVTNLANIALSFLFVYGFDMSIKGIALGSLLAQYIGLGMAFLLWWLHYRGLWEYRKLIKRWDWTLFRTSFAVNRDIFLRTLCLIFVTNAFTYIGHREGPTILAANALLMQFFILFSYLMDGFAYAGEALVGNYIGAKQIERLKQVIRLLFVWGAGIGISFTLIYLFGGASLLHVLTDKEEVLREARHYLPWVAAIPLAGFAAFILDGVMIGATSTRQMLIAAFVATITFIVVLHLFMETYHNEALWLAFVSYLFMRGAVQLIALPTIIKKLR